MSIETLYSNEDICLDLIRDSRKVFGNRETTEKQYDAMMKTLSFAYLYCPKDIQTLMLSTINEAEMRRTAFMTIWSNNG